MAPKDLIVRYDCVYYVDAGPSEPMNPVAIRPQFYDKHALWEDTSRGTVFYLDTVKTELTEEAPKAIEMISREGKRVTLRYLTLALYNEKVKAWVCGSPSFNSTEELQNFYLTESFGF
jgi:hypothetical protein